MKGGSIEKQVNLMKDAEITKGAGFKRKYEPLNDDAVISASNALWRVVGANRFFCELQDFIPPRVRTT